VGSPLLDFLVDRGPGTYSLEGFPRLTGLKWLREKGYARTIGKTLILFRRIL